MSSPEHASNEALWNARQAANFLGMSRNWVYRAAAEGTLPRVYIGASVRFEPEKIRAYVERNRRVVDCQPALPPDAVALRRVP